VLVVNRLQKLAAIHHGYKSAPVGRPGRYCAEMSFFIDKHQHEDTRSSTLSSVCMRRGGDVMLPLPAAAARLGGHAARMRTAPADGEMSAIKPDFTST